MELEANDTHYAKYDEGSKTNQKCTIHGVYSHSYVKAEMLKNAKVEEKKHAGLTLREDAQ